MQKLNNSQNPHFQKIVVKSAKNEFSNKDLLDFSFKKDENIYKVNDIFEMVFENASNLASLEKSLEEFKNVENQADTTMAKSIEQLSEQILLINKNISDRLTEIENKIKYIGD